ncbi:beta strand repeat-containing protein [Novipirellula maiorica]|nr:choice-of-anchor D domain-containing protein [Rhodopirellula maiorica]
MQISNSSNPAVTIGTASAAGTIVDNESISADLSVTTNGNETGPVGIVYTVTLGRANDTGAAITFDLHDLLTGTATSGDDYTAIAGGTQISVASGAMVGNLNVEVINDDVLESTETLVAQIANPSSPQVAIVTDTATATIEDNDTATADLSVTTQGNETGPVDIVFSVSLDKPNQTGVPITFDFDDLLTGTATSGSDYAAVDANAQISVPAGASNGTISVAVTDDALLEAIDTVMAQISNSSNPAVSIDTASASANIFDNDNAEITVNDATATEGNTLIFTVTLAGAVAGGFDVNVTFIDGAATGGVDYDNTPLVLNFVGTDGETQQFTVATTGDTQNEGTEDFTVHLNATNTLVTDIDTGTGSISDNGAVVQPEADLTVDGLTVPDQGSVEFGDVLINDSSPSKTFTVTNHGSSDLILQPINVPNGFVLTSSNFAPNQVVAPTEQVTFTVEMDTSSAVAVSGLLSFATNDADESNYRIHLSGVVIDPSGNPTNGGNGRLILDNGDNGFLSVDKWTPVASYGFESDALVQVGSQGDQRAIWAYDGLSPGGYLISLSWLNGSDRANNVPVVIRDGVGGPILDALSLNQSTAPQGPVIGGRPFEVLGSVTLSGSTLVIELSNQGVASGKAVVADAAMIQALAPMPAAPELTVRNNGVTVADEDTLTFPDVAVGTISSQTLTVRNDGNADLLLQPVSIVGSGFSLSSANFTVNQVLAPSEQVSLTINVDTTSEGTFDGSLSFGNSDADEGPFDLALRATVRSANATELTIDDGDPNFALTGPWSHVANYGFEADAKVITTNLSGAASWTFNGLSPGDHDVFATWLFGSDRASAVSYVIRDGVAGPILAVVPIDQRTTPTGEYHGGRPFGSLGSVTITGSTLVVELSNAGTNGAVIADAIRVEATTPAPSTPEIAVTQGGLTVIDGGNVNLGSAEQGAPQLTRVFTVQNTGTAELTLDPINVSGTGFTLESANFTPGQILSPGASTNFIIGLSTTTIGSFDGTVSFVNGDGNESPFDFSVNGTITMPQPTGGEIIDNGDTGFSQSGNWADVPGYGFGSDALAGNGVNGIETAQWEFTGLTANSNFEVSTTWLRGNDRESAVTYVIRDGVGGAVLATVTVDQTQSPSGDIYGGRRFQMLSSVMITGTTLVVELSTAGSTKAVIADAVRIEQQ